ncbi:hypothetical protein EVAR_38742_1 [Eumeta japonica]|uniref:Uncharacterized protein n=1 Tax=Eumeta variegata TaxID=151549 RepID=A0A4C1YQA1_EUMVA|nr:hypothetical protein EVAR_38742_1 [Eumeta japonica]
MSQRETAYPLDEMMFCAPSYTAPRLALLVGFVHGSTLVNTKRIPSPIVSIDHLVDHDANPDRLRAQEERRFAARRQAINRYVREGARPRPASGGR